MWVISCAATALTFPPVQTVQKIIREENVMISRGKRIRHLRFSCGHYEYLTHFDGGLFGQTEYVIAKFAGGQRHQMGSGYLYVEPAASLVGDIDPDEQRHRDLSIDRDHRDCRKETHQRQEICGEREGLSGNELSAGPRIAPYLNVDFVGDENTDQKSDPRVAAS